MVVVEIGAVVVILVDDGAVSGLTIRDPKATPASDLVNPAGA